MKKLTPLALCSVVVAACGSSTPSATTGTGGSGGGGGGAQPVLAMLSLQEAPAATESLYWGDLDVSAPGFAVGPRDQLTIGLDDDNNPRYLKWLTFPSVQKTYGDREHDFPLSGTRAVDLNPDFGLVFDQVTVLDSPAPTASHFLLRSRYVSTANKYDFIESVEGTKSGDDWAIAYSEDGALAGAAIMGTGTGTVYARDPNATAAAPGQPGRWSAPVELVAPGFTGPPVDHLTVGVDGTGAVQWFSFQSFPRHVGLAATTDDLPAGGRLLSDEGQVSFDSVVAPTPTHAVVRYHVVSGEQKNDFTEGLDVTLSGQCLRARYFISGTLLGATIDAHAAGSLTPASGAP